MALNGCRTAAIDMIAVGTCSGSALQRLATDAARYWRQSLSPWMGYMRRQQRQMSSQVVADTIVYDKSAPRFGRIKLTSSCDLRVIPHVQAAPLYDDRIRLRVVRGNRTADDVEGELVKLNITSRKSEPEFSLEGTLDRLSSDSCLMTELELPPQYDVQLYMKANSNLHIASMESNVCTLHINRGRCTLASVKVGRLSVMSMSGDVSLLGLAQGDIAITAQQNGNVSADRLQGNHISVHTEKGDVSAKAVYADQSSFTTESGNLCLGTLDGDLKLSSKGDVDIHVSRTQDTHLSSEGCITMKLDNSIRGSMQLTASEVNVDNSFVKTEDVEEEKQSEDGQSKTYTLDVNGPGPSSITAQARCINVSKQNWLSALNLTLPDP
ncbi:PREDICTED: uncharacterized protein LOC106813080 isoform X2 [Priapulus caudatus]|uniref:Uncharacterized protein LOC106813080 isoform X2 n=1 Tax=Priapulus caudatus TaxID=37621 RepID=A0ABM1EK97_PRICU|nr:PREDICTED: uncharacterized protein LOC106813080 isoform X2 [Priapulus caudatus]